MDGTFWHGRRLIVKFSGPRRRDGERVFAATPNRKGNYDGPPTNTLFVGNIAYDASDRDLNQLFGTLENVADVRVAVDKASGWPRGFAHAEFHSVQDALNARDKLDGRELRRRKLIVNFAPPVEDVRKARKADGVGFITAATTTTAAASNAKQAEAEAVQEEEQKRHQQTDWSA